jgi:hypothetical protein
MMHLNFAIENPLALEAKMTAREFGMGKREGQKIGAEPHSV